MQNIIKSFNKDDVNLIISDYPERVNPGEKNHGIAWHTHETTVPIAKKLGSRFVVLAEKGRNKQPELHIKNRILVLRVFDQKHHTLFPVILTWLQIFSKIKNVFIHSEFCTSGGIKNMILLIPFLMLIRIMGRKITFFEHNVINRFDSLATHFNLEKNSQKLKIFNWGIRGYYRMLGRLVDRIVVMDQALKYRLSSFIDPKKIICMPFWIQPKSYKLTTDSARKKLNIKNNEFLLISFGFVTWYKGADWLIDQIKALKQKVGNKKIRLILVGGEAYSLKDKSYYQNFYSKQLAKVAKNIQITGFVQESKLGLYFNAADLVVFPYRGFFGASGTLNYAISYQKPFLLSSRLSEITKSQDFQDALKESGLKSNDILFKLNKRDFLAKLNSVQDKAFIAKLKLLSEKISEKRNIEVLLTKFNNEIYSANKSTTLSKISGSFIPARIYSAS